MSARLLPLLSLILLLGCGGGEATAPLRIAAAADLAVVMPALIELHRQSHPVDLVSTMGSSGLLARQISQGAPFDLFLSANVSFVDELIAAGHGRAGTRALYARGRLVLWSRVDGVAPAQGLADLRAARFRRIAIANPAHAPYGLAAQQALIAAGLWEELRPRLVFGDNILATLQLCQSGNAELAIIALALAIPTPDGDWVLLDDALHEPIDQGLVVSSHSTQPEAAAAFARTLNSLAGLAILRRQGFVLPGETLDPTLLEAAGGRAAR